MTLEAALLSAVGALATALVAMFYIYVRQRDRDEQQRQALLEQVIPLLTELKSVATDMNTLVRQLLARVARETRHG